MFEVIGVKFKEVGKIYYFDPNGERFSENDRVIVETARGVECGIVAMPNRKLNDEKIIHPLKSVIRRANEEDMKIIEQNREKEKRAFKICEEKIA